MKGDGKGLEEFVTNVTPEDQIEQINRGRRHPLYYHLHSRTVASKKAAKLQGFKYLSIMFRTFPQHAKTAGKERAKQPRCGRESGPPSRFVPQKPGPTQPDALLLHRRCWMPGTVVRRAQPQPRPPFASTNHRRQARCGAHCVPVQGTDWWRSSAINTQKWPVPLLALLQKWLGQKWARRRWLEEVLLFLLCSACFFRVMGSSQPSSTPSRAPAWPPPCGR